MNAKSTSHANKDSTKDDDDAKVSSISSSRGGGDDGDDDDIFFFDALYSSVHDRCKVARARRECKVCEGNIRA